MGSRKSNGHKHVTILTIFLLFFAILVQFPLAQGKPLLQYSDLKFTSSVTFETGLIDLKIFSVNFQAILTLDPQFRVTRSQSIRDAVGSDSMTIGLASKELKGTLTLRAVDKDGKVYASQAIPFEYNKSPLGDLRIPLPEIQMPILLVSLTLSPRLVLQAAISTNVNVLGPASISTTALKWDSEEQKVLAINFLDKHQHVNVALTEPNYTLTAKLELGLKAIGVELTSISTPSITITAVGIPAPLSIADYNAVPKADFQFNPINPTTQDAIQFFDRSTDADGRIIEWLWTFGDGSTSAEQSPTHKFSAKGSYTVTLTVKDDEGATNSESKAIEVAEPPFPYTPLIEIVSAVAIVLALIIFFLYRR